jgi:hypothetical protein
MLSFVLPVSHIRNMRALPPGTRQKPPLRLRALDECGPPGADQSVNHIQVKASAKYALWTQQLAGKNSLPFHGLFFLQLRPAKTVSESVS